jgi:NADPH-dependent FMN reductase
VKEENRYLLALYTSPRQDGNTAALLNALVRGAKSVGINVKEFRTAGMDIRPCRVCNACFKNGECIQDDDMQQIFPHLLRAGAVAMAAPIFSMNICAQAKILIDRCQRFWSTRYVLKRKPVETSFETLRRGFFISCCGRDVPKTFDCTQPVLSYFYKIIQIADWKSLTFSGVDEVGAILKVEGALDEAYFLGESLRDLGTENRV